VARARPSRRLTLGLSAVAVAALTAGAGVLADEEHVDILGRVAVAAVVLVAAGVVTRAGWALVAGGALVVTVVASALASEPFSLASSTLAAIALLACLELGWWSIDEALPSAARAEVRRGPELAMELVGGVVVAVLVGGGAVAGSGTGTEVWIVGVVVVLAGFVAMLVANARARRRASTSP
jgi:hypothetical protein